MPETDLITVIIVSYNTRDITLKCLRRLFDGTRLPLEVIVVDNASTDGSPQAIAQAYPGVRVIRNDRNAGFASANNQAMRVACGGYFFLLNSDAFLRPGALEHLLDFLRAQPRAGVAGPRLLNADGSLQRSCYRFPSPGRAWIENLRLFTLLPSHPVLEDFGRWNHDRARTVDFVSGACMLVRRAAYEEVGGFDETFFLYAEEADWQYRMRAKGWMAAFTPGAEAIHLGGASGAAPGIRRHVFESLDRYQYKHYGVAGVLSLRLAMVVGNFLRSTVWAFLLVARPARRRQTLAKLKLSSWLLLRQSTHWRGVFSK
jgi:GT2 family glycosyltransferase